MPEGPSIVILREETAAFVGRRVRRVGGDGGGIDPQRMRGRAIADIRSWGKHYLVAFPGFALRVHFLLFGSYRINHRGPGTPRLSLGFAGGDELNFYACSLRYLEGGLDAHYDWSADLMADAWDPARARRKLRAEPDRLAADALLDQDVFAGSGNIIKNEVLHRIRVHPESRVGALPARKLAELVRQARDYSFDFYRWKRANELRSHFQVHTRSHCPRDGAPLTFRAQLGRSRRRAFYCERCQVLYG